jgi:hypothetical protein
MGMKRIYKKVVVTVLVGVATLGINACYQQGPEFIEDVDLVVTNHDVDFDYQSLTTYAIPDQVVKITGNLNDGDQVEFVDDIYATVILDAVRENLDNHGWTEVNSENNPDVIILPSAVSSTTFIWYYDNWYWDWWYPYSYWGWYYPYTYYGGSYTSGSLFLQMTYPEGITASDNIPVIWSCIANGLLEGSTSDINARIKKSIDQAFIQSQYLKLNND